MSYILEALKKSDQERNRGAAPGLQTVHTPVVHESNRRYWWVYLLAGALFVNAGLLLWWLQPWKASGSKADHVASQQQVASTIDQTSKPPINDVALVASTPDNKAAPSQPSAAATKEQQKPVLQRQETASAEEFTSARKDRTSTAAKNTAKNKTDSSPGSAELGVRKNDTAELQVSKPSVPAKAEATRRDAKPVDQSKEKQPAPTADVRERPSSTTDRAKPAPAERLAELHAKALDEALTSKPKPAQPGITPPDTADQMEQLPGLKSLPINIQKEIPDLALSFLVYADKPTDRMVNVNGQMMREGQEVAPGLKIEQITPDGAVFNYKGRRFKKGVL